MFRRILHFMTKMGNSIMILFQLSLNLSEEVIQMLQFTGWHEWWRVERILNLLPGGC